MNRQSVMYRLVNLAGVLAVSLMSSIGMAQITVGLDSSHVRNNFNSNFFGVNGQIRGRFPWANETNGVLDNPGFAATGIQVTSGGSGYTSVPTVTITQGIYGSGATAMATVSGGAVTAINITAGGNGFRPAPRVSLTGGGGTEATATAIVSSSGVVTAVVPIDIGTGYTSAPTVTIGDQAGGSGATATAIVSGGSVTGYTVTSGGSGYTPPPQVSISGGGGSGATAVTTASGGSVGPALGQLSLGTLRFPGGTAGSYWDWSAGDYVSNYYYATTPSLYTSLLSERQAELTAASQSSFPATQGVYLLNMLTDPQCTPTAPNPYCTLTPSSPNLPYQEMLLNTLENDNAQPAFIEMGNEYYFSKPCYTAVYNQDGGVYGALANTWISDIHELSGYSSAKTAGVAAHTGGNSALINWNHQLMYGNSNKIGPLTAADAVTLHPYVSSTGLAANAVVSASNADTMLYTPFSVWSTGSNSILNSDIASLTNSNTGYTPDIWITEYNLNDTHVAAFGTWAHGLFTATMSLLFLESDRVQMALHHDAQGSPTYSDVFQSPEGFNPPALSIDNNPSLPNGVASIAYSETLYPVGAMSTFSWSVASGSTLPPGLTLSTKTDDGVVVGVLGGTPPSGSNGTYNFGIQLTDTVSQAQVTQNFTLVVQSSGAPTLDCGSGPNVWTYPTNGANIATKVYGLTAQGLTTREVDTAALGQAKAQRLTFSGAGVPYFSQDGATPKLYGWMFSGGTAIPTQTVILNLSGSTQTVDLSSVSGISSGNSIRQLSATDPGTYVTGGVLTGAFQAVDYNMPNGSTSQPVTLTTGSLGGSGFPMTAVPLPAFSITRIY